jgi:hypothetical protein
MAKNVSASLIRRSKISAIRSVSDRAIQAVCGFEKDAIGITIEQQRKYGTAIAATAGTTSGSPVGDV